MFGLKSDTDDDDENRHKRGVPVESKKEPRRARQMITAFNIDRRL